MESVSADAPAHDPLLRRTGQTTFRGNFRRRSQVPWAFLVT